MNTVAAIQYKPPKGRVAEARKELVALITEAIEAGATLIVCPEMATSGYIWPDRESLLPFSEKINGQTAQVLRSLAVSNKVTIVCGFPERVDNKLYNSALLCPPWGQIYSYRKILLYDADIPWAETGEKRMMLQSPIGTVFPAICMDLNDPEMRMALRQNQPDFVAFCTNWIDDGEPVLPYWRYMLMGYDGVFIAANSYGEDSGTRFSGRSVILGPNGVCLNEAPPDGNCVITASIPKGFSNESAC